MQAHAAPVAGRQQWRFDVLELGSSFCVVFVEHSAPLCLAGGVRRILPQFSPDSVSGPATHSPVTTLLAPRVPTPCCTLATWRGCQLFSQPLPTPPCLPSSR